MTTFTPYTLDTAPDDAKDVLHNIQAQYGFIPNLFAFMAEAPTTIHAYLSLNDLVSKTSFTPAQQQIALLAASVENDCDFCTTAHQAFGKLHKVNSQTLAAIVSASTIEDDKDRVLAEFTAKVVKRRGRLEKNDIEIFFEAGFSKQQLLEVMLIVSIKTLSNYINHLTDPKANDELLAMI